MAMIVGLIAAISENNIIGNKGKIPWRIPEDLKHFKEITMGNPVIMGRKTYESLPNGPLKGRTNIVLTKDAAYRREGITVCQNIDEALTTALGSPSRDNISYVIGGEKVYASFLHIASIMEITRVRGSYQGDAYFPKFSLNEWILDKRDDREGYAFETYRRIN